MQQIKRIFVYALGILLISTVGYAADKPKITNFKIQPKEFTPGQPVTLSFDYVNVAGGLQGSQISLRYKGSKQGHTAKDSVHAAAIHGDTSESGTFSKSINITPTDRPPFKITYYLRIVDANGTKSNKAKARVKYLSSSSGSSSRKVPGDTEVAQRLISNSPFSGTWHVADDESVNGTLDLIFELDDSGGLIARVDNSTGTSRSFDGKVKDLRIAVGNTMSFVVKSGALYRLRFHDDNTLTGDARKGVAVINLAPKTAN